MNVWQILQGAAEAHGDRVALLASDQTWSEVHDLARALCGQLRARGVRPGDRVACLQDNSASHLLTYFAVAGAGAILVSLNTRLIASELRAILDDSGAALLVHDAGLSAPAAAATDDGGPPCVDVAALLAATADRGTEALELAGADTTAHLYYTSGTTGRPKGVMLSHRNVCVHAQWAVDELALTATDRWAHIAPMFHLADAWATFAITLVGGAHAFLPRFEAAAALDLLAEDQVTITNLVPTMLTRMVAEPDARARGYHLRAMLSGGAPIAGEVVRRILETFRCEYVQTYGMTETSPYLTVSLLSDELRRLPADEQLRLRCRTGRPFGGIDLVVVDASGEPVQPDDRAVGEVRVKGATVTCGYWQNPEATAAAFDERGYLRTGDLATIDGRGWVDIVDRIKDVIKTGGETVYTTEVEQVLHRHPAVLECAVFGTPDADWGEVVTAAVVLRVGASAGPQELIAFCRLHMAAYKAPRRVRLLASLPKTGSGKIQKNVLRDDR